MKNLPEELEALRLRLQLKHTAIETLTNFDVEKRKVILAVAKSRHTKPIGKVRSAIFSRNEKADFESLFF